MTQLRLAPNTADEVVIDTDAISSADFSKTHTGLSDFRITVERGLGVHDFALDELWLEQDDGTLLFRGLLEKIDEQEGRNVTPTATLSGKGIGYKLDRSSAFIEVTNPTFAADVIRNFWSDETPFSATVTDPTPANSVTDQTAQEASTTSEFEAVTSIADSDPLSITSDEIQLQQTCWTIEGEDSDTFSGTVTVTDSDFSNGAATSFDDVGDLATYDFEIHHTIPPEELGVFVRSDGFDSNAATVELTISGPDANGEQLAQNIFVLGTGLSWKTFDADDFTWNDPGELSPGTYTIQAECTVAGTSTYLDVIAPHDTGNRFGGFDYTLDNDNGGGGGYLDGPELYPQAFNLPFGAVDTPWNITDGTLNTTWHNTKNGQQIQVRLSNQTYFPNDGTEDNTESITTDFGDEVGQTIQGRATFSRYGNRTTATPQTGFKEQKLTSWEVQYDGNDNPIISAGETFEGTQLDVAQRLHSRADMRFVLSHSKDSLPANSFRAGDQTQPLPDVTINRKTTRTDLSNFFNQVEVFGQRDENGDRIKHLEDDQDAINEYGEQYWAEYDPSLETQEGVESKARAILSKKLRELSDKGELNVAPVDIAPGYSYNNPFDTGDETVPLEEISYRITNGEISGQLVFDFRTGAKLASDISGLRVNTRDSALGF